MLIDGLNRKGLRPSFPSSTSLQTLDDLTELMESAEEPVEDVQTIEMKEIIVAAKDRPQLLCRLTKALVSHHLLVASDSVSVLGRCGSKYYRGSCF